LAWVAACGASFAVLELRGFKRGCHRTLSRELQAWTHCRRHPWTASVFIALGAWLTVHLLTLKPVPELQT
jgi:hypothetical protein